MCGIQARLPSYQILGEWGPDREFWSAPACLYSLLQLFSLFNWSLPVWCTRACSPWWAATGPHLLLNILNINCDRASLTLYMSIDLVMIQWDIGVLFGVVKILKPTHIFNNNNCKKIMLSAPAENLLCLSSCYKHFHFSRPCDINIIIIPTLQRRKLRHNLKKLATQWWCETRINWGS